jgi:hypothetical protein
MQYDEDSIPISVYRLRLVLAQSQAENLKSLANFECKTQKSTRIVELVLHRGPVSPRDDNPIAISYPYKQEQL